MSSSMSAINFLQSLKQQFDQARETATLIQAFVVDEVAGRVRLRFGDETAEDAGEERYARAAGPPFAPGTEVLCQRTGTTLFVVGAVQYGAGDPSPSVDGTGGAPGAPVFDVLCVVVRSLRWQGTDRTMTSKQLALANRMVAQFPAMLQLATGGRVGVRVRLVVQTDTWDLDAAIAAGTAEVATFGTTGRWLTEEGAQALWSAYDGLTYDSRVLFLGTGQMDSTVNGITRRDAPYSFVNVEDGWFDADRAANRVTDVLVREVSRQVEERLRDLGADHLELNDPAASGATAHAVRAWLDWFRTWWAAADLTDLADDGRLSTIDPRTSAVPFTPVDPDDSWSRATGGGGDGGGSTTPQALDWLTDVDGTAAGTTGQVLTRQSDGQWRPASPSSSSTPVTVTDTASLDLTIAGQNISGAVVFGGTGSAGTAARSDHTHAASAITSGVIAPARLGTGTASSGTVLYGDGTFKAAPTGGGSGAAALDDLSDVDGAAAGTTGQVLTRQSDGQYRPATLAGGGTPVTVSDTASVDMVITGQNIAANVIFSGTGSAGTAARSDHTHVASAITSGVFPPARLGTGTASSGTVLYGDGTFKPAPSGGSGGSGVVGNRLVWNVLIVVPRSVRYQGVTRTMTTKEWTMAVRVTEQFAGLMEQAAGHVLDTRVRAVFRTTVWDLDADIAAGGAPPSSWSGGGFFYHQACAATLLNTYYGDMYDAQVIIQAKSILACSADGLTIGRRSSPGLSTLLLGDGNYDSYAGGNVLADVLIHEHDHQMEYRFQQEGVPSAQVVVDGELPGVPGSGPGSQPNVQGASTSRINWFNHYLAWWDHVTEFVQTKAIKFRSVTPTFHAETVPIYNRVVQPDNGWEVYGGTGSGGGVGDANQTLDVYGEGVGLVSSNPNTLDFKAPLAVSEPSADLIRIALQGTAQTYTTTNVTTDRTFNADSTTLAEIADVLGTLIADLRNRGLVA